MNLAARTTVTVTIFSLGACASWLEPIVDEPSDPSEQVTEALEGEVETIVDASEEAEMIVEESDEAEFIVDESDEAETIVEEGDEAEAIIGAVDSMNEDTDE